MAASRQSTSESTVAWSTEQSTGDADPRWSPRERINSLKMNLNTKLSFIPEQRGWRYFFMHKVGPHVLTLVAGVLIGVLVTMMIVNSTVDAEPYKVVQLWDPHLRPEYADEPLAKKTVRYFDGYLIARAGLDGPETFQANVNRGLAPDITFESVSWGPGGSTLYTHGRDAWTNSGEERQFRHAFGKTELFTQMMFFGDNETVTTTSYGTLFWDGDLFGVQAPKKWIDLRVCDFYRVREDSAGIYGGLITYNFMMIDWADVLHRAGISLLPPSELDEGLVLPPSANDGVPAPYSILARSRTSQPARAMVNGALKDQWVGNAQENQWWHDDMLFYGPRGIGFAKGYEAFKQHILTPFHAAFTQRTLDLSILTCEGNYCAAQGHIIGLHSARWLGVAPRFVDGKALEVKLRFGMHFRVVDGKAKEGWAIFDVPGFFQQVGLDFFKSAAARQNMTRTQD